MPRDVLPAMAETMQSLTPGDLVTLFILDLNPIGVDEIYRYTTTIFPDGVEVVHDGNTYLYAPVTLRDVDWSVNGDPPSPKVTFPNAKKFLAALVVQHNDLVGASLTRLRTYRQFLDGESLADPDAVLSMDLFRVEQKLNLNSVIGEFALRPLRSIEHRMLPGMVCLKNVCSLRYRRWDAVAGAFVYDTSALACPYTGIAKFTRSDVSTTDSALDVCSKTLNGCIARFANAPLPGTFKPGMSRTVRG